MEIFDLFTQQQIQDVLKRTFSSSANDISFSVDSKAHKTFTLLNVKTDGVEQTYVLMKLPDNLISEELQQLENLKITKSPQMENSKVLYPVFLLKNSNKQCYGAFKWQLDVDNFVIPERNDVECLKIILQNLVENQAEELANNNEADSQSEYNLTDTCKAVTSLEFFKELDTAVMQETIESLQEDLNKLLKNSKLLVRSVGCPSANNVFVNHNINRSIFLNSGPSKVFPPAYDALLYIFALSDEKFRQEHFEDLVNFYFESLIKFLQSHQSNAADTVTISYSEQQIKVLLPVVKFKIISSSFNLKHKDVFTNLLYFFKYPLINQEDIYEITKNKIGSSAYDLLAYSLVSLSEKNGHLGLYFHLDIKIKAEEQEQELKLFAKILKPPSEMMNDILQRGPAKKENFFYKTFLPLCVEHNLDSLLDFAPRCYLSRLSWLVILDDLSRQNYVGLRPNTVLNYKGLRASIEQLAKFHSCTIILEEILSKMSGSTVRLDQNYGEFLEEIMLTYEGEGKKMFDGTVETYCSVVEKFPEVTAKVNVSPEEFKERFKNAFLSIFSKVKKSDSIRNVINHGDMYVANMLFKFGKDKMITESKLIDFQVLRYVPPTYDLLFFLFINSTKETRDKHLKTLVEDYYSFISENLKKFNINAEIVFPKKEFDENIKFMIPAGIAGAMNYALVIHIDPDLREEIFHDPKKLEYYFGLHMMELVELSLKVEHYRIILKGLLDDMVDIIKSEF